MNPRTANRKALTRSSKLRGRLNTIKRAEIVDDRTSMTMANDLAVRRALEAAGVEFIDGNGGGPGVRLRKRQAQWCADNDRRDGEPLRLRSDCAGSRSR